MSLSIQEIQVLETQFNTVLNAQPLDALARETQFIQRKTNRIIPKDFIQLMSLELMSHPTASHEELCRVLSELNPQIQLKPSSLNERLNSEECVEFLKQVFQGCLQAGHRPLLSSKEAPLLEPFGRILLEDSTQCELNSRLSAPFKGSGGCASPASVKINLIEDLKNSHLERLDIVAGAKADHSMASQILEILRPRDLVLRDLGYFTLESFVAIHQAQAFFLSRLSQGVHVYLQTNPAEIPLDLPAYLNRHFPQDSLMELSVCLGKEHRLPARLIAYRLPEEVVNRRRQQAQKQALKKGRTCSEAHLHWLAFGFYITNVPLSLWPAEVIGTLYRLRWQIELTFKRWKSLLRIDDIQGTLPQRVYCLIYGRLIAVALLHRFYGYAAAYVWKTLHKELSPYQLYDWLLQRQRLASAIRQQTLLPLFYLFTQVMESLCKQNRTRKTTLQLIQEEVEFLDSFQNNPPP